MKPGIGEAAGFGRGAVGMAWGMALLLLAATLAWHVPMMLWDHLDLVPMYEAWQSGAFLSSEAVRVHDGSHLHFPAYVLLLGTTRLSGGQTLLDCVLAWALLSVYAWLMLSAVRHMLPDRRPPWLLPGLVGFILHPGHLANTQWGWQVAVFLCLGGCAAVLAILSGRTPGWRENGLALFGMLVATTSFSTGFAIVPVALALILLHREIPPFRRFALAVPWVVCAVAIAVFASGGTPVPKAAPADFVLYVLNYIGGGVARFATDLAPWLTAFALISSVACALAVRSDPKARFWLACMVFSLGAAALTALGRAEPFGTDHAFASRYVSFSSVFWVGWLGLTALALEAVRPPLRRLLRGLVVVALLLGIFNALHMAKKAREVAERSAQTAATIRSQYPVVDDAVLQEIYFGRSEQAKQRLDVLHRQRFAPFDAL